MSNETLENVLMSSIKIYQKLLNKGFQRVIYKHNQNLIYGIKLNLLMKNL